MSRAIPGPKRSFKVDFPLLLLRIKQEAKKPSKDFSVPRDGIVRAVASIAAKARRKSAHISRFDRTVRTYCGMVMGYTDRYTVEEYVYSKLKRLVASHVAERASLRRRDLEVQADAVFHEIEAAILVMAANGHPVKHGKGDDRCRVWSRLHERNGMCFLTLEKRPHGGRWQVLSLEPKGKFRRRMRACSGRKNREYRNLPKHKRF
ncbi:hypothetical protein KKF59_04555 [Patescibacteria group bacterium]|nr:hypothetical protein [Patescibacteria group bacterium]MBU1034585.1 hypothetical protein [Patescibacteria group bacterium]MBU1629803.1 hypothetical protein [Patescibacteria group bacterium]MBU1908366.1 hypothetical protein [Patescibacteria group bacterium]